MFTILAGEAEVSFLAHAGVLSKSEVLKKEVEGGWKEGQERTIRWRDWTVAGVERFLEWLYTGDYQCPHPTKVSVPEAEATESDQPATQLEPPAEEDVVITGAQSPVEKPKEKYDRHFIELPDLDGPGYCALTKTTQAGEFDQWIGHQYLRTGELDYSDTFLTHAEIYVMASRYMLDELKSMAWNRLRSVCITVGNPDCGSPVYSNMVALIEYVYRETGASFDDKDEPLRGLVTTFAASRFWQMKSSGLDKLLTSSIQSSNEFAVDLSDKVALRVKAMETEGRRLTRTGAVAQTPAASVGVNSTSTGRKRCTCCRQAGRSRDECVKSRPRVVL